MKKGFTLVELAIVLVIIGLLVGGVLQGQELIRQAKLNKVISQLTDLKRSVATFQSKYGQLPGDFNKATKIWGTVPGDCLTDAGTGTETCDGNGDGALIADTLGFEPWRVWEHLTNAGLVSGTYTGIPSNSCIYGSFCYAPGSNAPAGPIDNSTWNFTYLESYYTWGGKVKSRNAFGFGSIASDGYSNGGNGWPGRWHHGVLSVEDSYAIDTKLDDGMPFKGIVTEISDSPYTPGCTSSENSATSTATYVLSNADRKCALIFDY